MLFQRQKSEMPGPGQALPGRSDKLATAERHFVNQRPLQGPYPEGVQTALFGLGCFWGAERKFRQAGEGIWITAVGYAGGATPNPTYEEVCSCLTGHNEVVLVAFDPAKLSYEELLKLFWENHNPTQGMRQGNDIGTQYRSGIYVFDAAQRAAAERSKAEYGAALAARGFGPVTTEIRAALLFRRGLSPAVPGQEPGRLLRSRRHRRDLSDRHRRARLIGGRRTATLSGTAGCGLRGSLVPDLFLQP